MAGRDTALAALVACRTRKAWSDGAIKEALARDRLDAREAAMASRLFYAVLQNRLLLDWHIDRLVKNPKALQPVVRDVLRLGVCQLMFFDRIPASAAVNEAVNQTKKKANPQAAGLVNGVLRSFLRQKAVLPVPEDPCIRYSCPPAMTELLKSCVGDELLEPLLRCQNEAPPTALQVNTLRISADELLVRLRESGAEAELHPFCPDCILLEGSGNLAELPEFTEGLFYVQDAASKIAVRAARLQPGMRVLDCCAAPGGKSFAAAIAMENKGKLLSGDKHAHKIRLIEAGAERLGITILQAAERDASVPVPGWEKQFDAVLCDAPCSGLGTIRKKPDIRFKDPKELEGFPTVQSHILEAQSAYVKPGGLLLYSTCTLVPAENAGVTGDFLSRHPEFHREPAETPFGRLDSGELTMLPPVHNTDGFYFCLMRRDTE